MDLLSLRYFVEVAKDLHITRTANRLYISQQSLSNHIQRLEKHYGVQLLKRKPTLQLTLAGEELLRFAEAMIQENANLTDRLFDIQQGERALLRFGASTGRLNVCLPIISKLRQIIPTLSCDSTIVFPVIWSRWCWITNWIWRWLSDLTRA